MLQTIIGVIVLLIPFLLLYRFKDKKEGFVTILLFFLIFHLSVAVITQFFGIFSYLVVLFICIASDFIILGSINYNNLKTQIKKIQIDSVLLIVIIISFFCLYAVHNNYTGTVTSAVSGFTEVKNLKYPYPYFSDEWSAVSVIQYSIATGNLPLTNPLWHNTPFDNLELPFHSFISEIMLLLGLDPLTQYSLLHIFTGILIISLIYLILRKNCAGKMASSISSLSVLYIVNGANLPGIWTLIPLIIGLICFLICLFFMSSCNKKMTFISSFMTLIFYPPLFVIWLPAILVYTLFSNETTNKKIRSLAIYFFILLLCAVLLGIIWLNFTGSFLTTFDYIKGRIFYPTLTKDAIPDFSIIKVIPIPILLLVVPALMNLKKKNSFIFAPIIIGLLYWFLYSNVLFRVIIEYERIVVSTSILIVLFSGFGVQWIIDFIKKNHKIKNSYFVLAQILIFILFLILSFSYTQSNNWEGLKLHPISGGSISPASPANIYLNENDLVLFEDIKQKNFLSLPWKGLVIGAATNNYPLETKPATLTIAFLKYSYFMSVNCTKKSELARQYDISYVYSRKFECKDFREIAISQEELHLYEFIK